MLNVVTISFDWKSEACFSTSSCVSETFWTALRSTVPKPNLGADTKLLVVCLPSDDLTWMKSLMDPTEEQAAVQAAAALCKDRTQEIERS